MAFLDKIGKKIGDAAGSASEMAKDFAETTKLNSAISAEEKQINQYFLEIGKYIFDLEKENVDSPVAGLCNKIIASQKTIEVLKQSIKEIKND